jgi:lysophospholipase L1-like esterase
LRLVRAFLPVVLLLTSCAPLHDVHAGKLPVGARYVAMGSSFASGPGVTKPADDRDPRCTRSNDNYARQTARRFQLDLVDVSCGGATTAHMLEGWNELPPQIDALNAETRLVTVTIGGNDVGYVAGLFAGSCGEAEAANEAVKTACTAMRSRRGTGGPSVVVAPDEAKWSAVEAGLGTIAAEVSRRSPNARLIFVQYLTLVPDGPLCATVPLSPEAAPQARETAARLARLTKTVARRSRAEYLSIADLSRRHDACADKPWVNGFVPATNAVKGSFAPYHPNLAGMTAIAEALVRKLRQRP